MTQNALATDGAPMQLSRARLRTPHAAAVAGILFSVPLIYSLWLLQFSIPADPMEAGTWVETSTRLVNFALNLVPFAGIAFMWFVGVLRIAWGGWKISFSPPSSSAAR